MADHAGGIGYAHSMDLRIPIPRQPKKFDQAIVKRWLEIWEPLCAMAAARTNDPADAFRAFRDGYNRRITTLLQASLAWNVIRHGNLDDPRATGTEFDRGLCLAIERRRCRMNRTKGKKRGPYAHRERDGIK